MFVEAVEEVICWNLILDVWAVLVKSKRKRRVWVAAVGEIKRSETCTSLYTVVVCKLCGNQILIPIVVEWRDIRTQNVFYSTIGSLSLTINLGMVCR